MTGDCGDPVSPGYLAYEIIASTSSGQVFHLKKSDVDEVEQMISNSVEIVEKRNYIVFITLLGIKLRESVSASKKSESPSNKSERRRRSRLATGSGF